MVTKNTSRMVRFASFFSGADETPEVVEPVEFSLPEDLEGLSNTEVEELHTTAMEHFNAVYGDGSEIKGDTLETLNALTEAIEVLAGEKATREEAAAALSAQAAELKAKVSGTLSKEPVEIAEEDLEEDDEEEALPEEKLAQKRVIKLPSKSSAEAKKASATAAALANTKRTDVKDVLISVGEGLGVLPGTGTDFAGMGEALDKRLKTFNLTQYQNAHSVGRNLREVGSFASIKRESDFTINSNDQSHIAEVIAGATSVTNMRPKKSLLASGGWAAASEVLYDEFLQLEATAGGLSTPEIVLARGGVQLPTAVSFADIFAATGFDYTEAEDIAGTYEDDGAGNLVEGPKPSYHLDIPEFTDHRLDVYGLIIEAGLLAARGYPEYLADVIRKALVAHFHKMNAAKIADIAAGSTAVTMPSQQVGATAPILSALELQAEHYRDTHRMAPGATLEVVIPAWIIGVVRSDLARRQGVDLIDVSDARIAGWFSQRNLAVQLVQDYQSISTTGVAAFTQWPSTVQFLMYAAGTWVAGKSDIITLDTLYDSTNLKNNDFTALFTEEGQNMMKVGPDSRKVTVSLQANGATHIGDEIAHDGTAVVVTP